MRAWLGSDSPASRTQARLGRAYAGWLSIRRNPLALSGLAIVALLVLIALLGPSLAPGSPAAQDLRLRLAPPSASHWFGTDALGRDILVRLLYGARITLGIILLVGVIVLPVGLVIGTVAGYAGGLVETALMRLTDIFLAFPRLALALAIVAALKPGIGNAIVAIALTTWPAYARIARAETRAIRNADYIEAARLQGASGLRILWSHVIPQCLPSVIVRLTLDMAGVVLTAAGLGFLGLGAQPPTPEWGLMIADGRQYVLDQWWVSTIPGVAVCIVSIGFNLLGDGLRDLLDPRSS